MGRDVMIRQRFDIEEYGWKVAVYYAVDCYYTDEIMGRLYDIAAAGMIWKRRTGTCPPANRTPDSPIPTTAQGRRSW